MSNVVPLMLRQGPQPADTERRTAACAAELAAIVERLRETCGQIARLDRPGLDRERTLQLLLDAVTAVEQATEAVVDRADGRSP